jgi:hypothetical protein
MTHYCVCQPNQAPSAITGRAEAFFRVHEKAVFWRLSIGFSPFRIRQLKYQCFVACKGMPFMQNLTDF